MKKGYYWGDTKSGEARKISIQQDGVVSIALVPVSQTFAFRKLPHTKGDMPIPCIFQPSEWLCGVDGKIAGFPEA
jgi:hypothetical protein